jgi:predicted enzyme related to lactoylglutathione lyase
MARGARLIARMPDHDLWLAAVRDPEGNIIELMSEARRERPRLTAP